MSARMVGAVGEGELLRGVGGERDAARPALAAVWRSIASGSLAPIDDEVEAADPVRRSAPSSMSRASAHRPGVEGGDLGHVAGRSCRRSGRCAGTRRRARRRSRRRGARASCGSRRSPRRPRPTRIGRWPRLAMPKAMLAATPPRRTCRSSTQERQRDLVELLDDEGVGEPARGRSSGGRSRWNR